MKALHKIFRNNFLHKSNWKEYFDMFTTFHLHSEVIRDILRK